MRTVLITGVRGKTGLPLARLLAGRAGVAVRGGSSDPSTVTVDGVAPTAFDWDDPAGWPAATADVDGVYVVRPDRVDAPELIAGLLEVAPVDARVVLLSERDPERGPVAWSLRCETVVRGSGRAWAVLRPSWFMQVLEDPRFLLADLRERGELPFSSGGADVAWIDARDIAAVAQRALLDEDLTGSTLELSGPEALSLPRTAEILADALGRSVRHVETSADEAFEGMSDFERELTAITWRRVHAGVFAEVTDTVERVTGRPARSLADFTAELDY